MIFPGYGAPNATLRLLVASIEKHRHEQRLAGQQPLAGAHQRAQESALLLREPSPKIVSISTPSSMYIMPPASATVASFGIQLDFDELHVVAEDLVVDLVHRGHA